MAAARLNSQGVRLLNNTRSRARGQGPEAGPESCLTLLNIGHYTPPSVYK